MSWDYSPFSTSADPILRSRHESWRKRGPPADLVRQPLCRPHMIFRTSPGSVIRGRLWLLPTLLVFTALLRLNKVDWDFARLVPTPFLYVVFVWVAFTMMSFLIAAISVSIDKGKVIVKKITGTREIPKENFKNATFEKNSIVVALPNEKATPYAVPRIGFSKDDWKQLNTALTN